MKKLIVLLLTTAVLVSLAGCSGASQSQGSSQPSSNVPAASASNAAGDAGDGGASSDEEAMAASPEENAYAAYGSKVRELMGEYGQPDTALDPNGSGITYATGLVYADLVDFGDGSPRLVVGYLDQGDLKDPSSPGAYPEDYKVEVWEYGSGGLECVYSGSAQLGGQNSYCGSIAYQDVDGRRYLETWGGSYGGPDGEVTRRAYGLRDDGKFGVVEELDNVYSPQHSEYTVNGDPVSADVGEETVEKWFNYDKGTRIRLSSISSESDPTSLVRETAKVVEMLEAFAADE